MMKEMKFWGIAYKWDEDYFYNFEEKEDRYEASAQSLLPTKELADDYIEEQLGSDYIPVEITLTYLSKDGVYMYERGQVDEWDRDEVK